VWRIVQVLLMESDQPTREAHAARPLFQEMEPTMIPHHDLIRLVQLLTKDGRGFTPTPADEKLVWKFERYQRTGRWGEWYE